MEYAERPFELAAAGDGVRKVTVSRAFFDDLNYGQLADFFYVWQRHILNENGRVAGGTTRADGEAQQAEAQEFADRLPAVRREANRVLRPEGLLVFTYHHSRPEGWSIGVGSADASRVLCQRGASDKGRDVDCHAEASGEGAD